MDIVVVPSGIKSLPQTILIPPQSGHVLSDHFSTLEHELLQDIQSTDSIKIILFDFWLLLIFGILMGDKATSCDTSLYTGWLATDANDGNSQKSQPFNNMMITDGAIHTTQSGQSMVKKMRSIKSLILLWKNSKSVCIEIKLADMTCTLRHWYIISVYQIPYIWPILGPSPLI